MMISKPPGRSRPPNSGRSQSRGRPRPPHRRAGVSWPPRSGPGSPRRPSRPGLLAGDPAAPYDAARVKIARLRRDVPDDDRPIGSDACDRSNRGGDMAQVLPRYEGSSHQPFGGARRQGSRPPARSARPVPSSARRDACGGGSAQLPAAPRGDGVEAVILHRSSPASIPKTDNSAANDAAPWDARPKPGLRPGRVRHRLHGFCIPEEGDEPRPEKEEREADQGRRNRQEGRLPGHEPREEGERRKGRRGSSRAAGRA